jgi:APA family basic amino acid/polyamine antiporter
MAVALVMGNMIGSGVFLLPSALALFGGLGLMGWVVSAAGSIMLALVFARLSRIDPSAGGPYAYTRHAFGDLAGFLVAWGYWISIWCGNAAIAAACVGYLEPFFPRIVHTPTSAAMLAAGFVWLLTAVNVWGVRTAGQVQVVTTVLKVMPLVLIAIAGFMRFDPAPFVIAETGARAIAGKLAAAATLTFWAFGGLESATIPAGSIDRPETTIPRATIIGTILAAILYIVSTIGVMSLVAPSVLKVSPAPFADAARAFAGSGAADLVALGAAIACFGALNGWILIAGQIPLAVASDGLFPKAFARVSPRHTPAFGLIVSGALTTVLIALNSSRGLVDLFTFIILLGTLSALVPYAFSSLAGFLIAGPGQRGKARTSMGASIIALLAFSYSLWAIGGAGAEVVYWGFILLLAGLPVYVWVVRRQDG